MNRASLEYHPARVNNRRAITLRAKLRAPVNKFARALRISRGRAIMPAAVAAFRGWIVELAKSSRQESRRETSAMPAIRFR